MFGHTSANHRIFIYPNPDAKKIKIETFDHVEGVCFTEENATCKTSLKGKTLEVTSTFPKLVGSQTFTFNADTAHASLAQVALMAARCFPVRAGVKLIDCIWVDGMSAT